MQYFDRDLFPYLTTLGLVGLRFDDQRTVEFVVDDVVRATLPPAPARTTCLRAAANPAGELCAVAIHGSDVPGSIDHLMYWRGGEWEDTDFRASNPRAVAVRWTGAAFEAVIHVWLETVVRWIIGSDPATAVPEPVPFANRTTLGIQQLLADGTIRWRGENDDYIRRRVGPVTYADWVEAEGVLIGKANNRTEGVVLATAQPFVASAIEGEDLRIAYNAGRWLVSAWAQGGREFMRALPPVPPWTLPAVPAIPVFAPALARPLDLGQYKFWWAGDGQQWPDPDPLALPYTHVVCESAREVDRANKAGYGVITSVALAPLAADLVAVKVSNDGGDNKGRPLDELIRAARPYTESRDVALLVYIDRRDPADEWPTELRPYDVVSWQMFARLDESLEDFAKACRTAIRFCLAYGQRFVAPVPQAFDRTWEWPANALGNLQAVFAELAAEFNEPLIAYTYFSWGREGTLAGRTIGGTRVHQAEILPWHAALADASPAGRFRWPRPSAFRPTPPNDDKDTPMLKILDGPEYAKYIIALGKKFTARYNLPTSRYPDTGLTEGEQKAKEMIGAFRDRHGRDPIPVEAMDLYDDLVAGLDRPTIEELAGFSVRLR